MFKKGDTVVCIKGKPTYLTHYKRYKILETRSEGNPYILITGDDGLIMLYSVSRFKKVTERNLPDWW